MHQFIPQPNNVLDEFLLQCSSYSSIDKQNVSDIFDKLKQKIKRECFEQFDRRSWSARRKICFYVLQSDGKHHYARFLHHYAVLRFSTNRKKNVLVKVQLTANNQSTSASWKVMFDQAAELEWKPWNNKHRLHFIIEMNASIPTVLNAGLQAWLEHGQYSAVSNNCQTVLQKWVEMWLMHQGEHPDHLEKVKEKFQDLTMTGGIRKHSGKIGNDSVDLMEEMNGNNVTKIRRGYQGLQRAQVSVFKCGGITGMILLVLVALLIIVAVMNVFVTCTWFLVALLMPWWKLVCLFFILLFIFEILMYNRPSIV